jgi:hypothetical protein
MEIYLVGVFIALIINMIIIVFILFSYFSLKSKNLKKIGLYFNIWSSNYVAEKTTWVGFLFYTVYMLVISPLFSWLSAGFTIFLYVKGIVNKVPVPEKIKEINFKLSSVDLPKDKVQEYMSEFGKYYGYDCINVGDRILDTDDPDLYVIEPATEKDEWYREIRLNRPIKNYIMYSRTPDYDAQFTDVNEYKFVGTNLLTRTIEDKSEFPGDEHWDIKDNVVMELDVKTRMEKNRFDSQERIDEKISDLKKQVDWSECKINNIKYFIMFRHDDIFSNFDLKKFMRTELERIKYGYKKLEDEVKSLGGDIENKSIIEGTKHFLHITCKENTSEENREILNSILQEDHICAFGISYYEFLEVNSLIKELENYLERLSKRNIADS